MKREKGVAKVGVPRMDSSPFWGGREGPASQLGVELGMYLSIIHSGEVFNDPLHLESGEIQVLPLFPLSPCKGGSDKKQICFVFKRQSY